MADEREQGKQGHPQTESEQASSKREQESRSRSEAVAQKISENKHRMVLERALDETLAESFPASDPASSIPAPCCEEEPNAA
jgi:hypothetical protein